MISKITFNILQFIISRKNKLFNISLFLLLIAYVTIRILFIFSTNLGFQHGEEDNIWNVINVIDGKKLYTSPLKYPFEIYLYTPLSQLINICIIKIINIKSIYTIAIILRSISFIFNIATVIVFYKTIKITSTNISKSTILWLSTLVFTTLIHLNWTIRVDACSIFLLTLAFHYWIKNTLNKSFIKEFHISLIITLAIFTKQDGIQLLFLLPMITIFFVDFWYGIRIGIYSTLFCILTFLGIDFIYNSNFSLSVIGGVSNPYSIGNAFSVTNRYFQLYSILPLFILFCTIYFIFKGNDKLIKSSALLTLGVFIFAVGTSMKLGAWVNYFSLFNILGIFLISNYIDLFPKIEYKFKFISLLFVVYFLSGTTYHYLTPEFKYDKSILKQTEKTALNINNTLPKNALVYTNNDMLELCLFNKTIFPNQVFYPDMNTFKFDIDNKILNRLYIVKKDDSDFDFVELHYLKVTTNKMLFIKKINGFTIYKLNTN